MDQREHEIEIKYVNGDREIMRVGDDVLAYIEALAEKTWSGSGGPVSVASITGQAGMLGYRPNFALVRTLVNLNHVTRIGPVGH